MSADASDVPLTHVDGVRQRAAMYIGSSDLGGLHLLLDETLAFYLEGVLRGVSERIEITLHTDGSCTLRCDGPGLPLPEVRADGTPGLIAACTRFPHPEMYPEGWGAGRLFYLTCGLITTNALAERLEIAVRRGDEVWGQRFQRGYPVGPTGGFGLQSEGSYLHWLPDAEVFGSVTWDLELLRNRLQTLAFLAPNAHLRLADERSGNSWAFRQPAGLAELVERLNSGRVTIHPPLHLELVGEWGSASLALQYQSGWPYLQDYSGELVGFANLRPVTGVPVEAFERALTGALNDFSRRIGFHEPEEPELTWSDVRIGLRAAISVVLPNAQWGGKYREWLSNEELLQPLQTAIRLDLKRAIDMDEPRWRQIARSATFHAHVGPKRERLLRLKRGRRVRPLKLPE
jgi:DNA gyrase subunit B